jgi:hypothetical protein
MVKRKAREMGRVKSLWIRIGGTLSWQWNEMGEVRLAGGLRK